MDLTRRRLLGAAGALALPTFLGGCGGFSTSSGDDDAAGGDSGTLTVTTWGTDSELAGLRAAVARFEESSGARVALDVVPYEQMFSNVDAQIQAGNPPDVFRVPYYTFGSYAGRGQLLDLSPYLEDGFADRFTPQAWAAVQSDGAPYGVPHHTDTSAILVNTELLGAAGITELPASPEEAWTWDQLAEVATTLRGSLPAEQYPFAVNWQGNGVTRWLSWLFQADGRFLTEDLSGPAIDSAAAREAVAFTQSFFTQGWVPPNSSVQSATYSSDSWYAQTVAMVWGGAFLVPDAEATLDFEWTATYAPRKVRGGSDFGGNALVATAGTPRAELAAAFLASVTEEESMREFCAGASLLPTRTDLVEQGIEFAVRPELSPVFVGQAGVVLPEDSGQVASPDMASIITVLQDALEGAFVGGQDVETTITAMSDGIAAAVR